MRHQQALSLFRLTSLEIHSTLTKHSSDLTRDSQKKQEAQGDLQEHLLFNDLFEPRFVTSNGGVELIVCFHH